MSELIINNSYCKLKGFDLPVIATVKKVLTYTDEEVIREKQMLFYQIQKAKARRQTGYMLVLKEKFKELGPDTVCWLDANNEFPTGLLHLVKPLIKSSRYATSDQRNRPEPYNTFRWNNKPSELRYYQEEAVAKFTEQGRGVLSMAVGSGKTRVATEIIKQLGVNTLFVVPSSALLIQAYDVFSDAFGTTQVQKITTPDLKKNKKLKPIRVVTIQTLASLSKQGLLNTLVNDVDCLIIDEAHHSGSESYTKLLNALQGIYFRLAMTGTYLRNDSKTLDLWGVCGEVVFEYNAVKATEEGYLTPVEFNIVKLKGKMSNNYQTEYRDAYSSNELMDSVVDIIRNKVPAKSQVLVLVDRKEACGHIIFEYLNKHKISCSYVNGDDSKENIANAIEDFNEKKIRILIASTVLGEGVDLRSTDHLIMCRGGKSEIAMTQAVGRAVRLYDGKRKAYVWDFNFRFCRYLPRHIDIRIDTYEKQFGGKVNYLE